MHRLMTHIIIFGASEAGRRAIEHYRGREDIRILGVTDNDPAKHGGTLDGIQIMPPAEIVNHPYDQVIIASMYHQQITQQLTRDLSVPVDKIDVISTMIQKGNIDLTDETRRALARDMMLAVCEALNHNQIPYHIDHGTLLGIYRDGDLLPWDNDIDLAIHIRDIESVSAALDPISRSFRSAYCEHNAWHCTPQTGPILFGDTPRERVRILKFENTAACDMSRELKLDLIVKHPHNGHLHWLAGATPLTAGEEYFAERATLKYRDVPLSIPRETDIYLTKLFGDWRLRRRDWNHAQYENISLATPVAHGAARQRIFD